MTDKNKLSVDRFSVVQMFNNSEGKTSGMLFVCTIGCLSAVICFSASFIILFGASVYGIIVKEKISDLLPPDITGLLNNMMFQAISMFALGGTGLGIRRFTTDKHVLTEDEKNNISSSLPISD